jgi:hypothetical protein
MSERPPKFEIDPSIHLPPENPEKEGPDFILVEIGAALEKLRLEILRAENPDYVYPQGETKPTPMELIAKKRKLHSLSNYLAKHARILKENRNSEI